MKNKTKPVISIIYVYYNTDDLIVQSINSINKGIEEIPHEVIVVDNASKQKLNLNKLIQVKIIENKENYGYAKAVNQGAREAKGNYLLIVNSDIEFKQDSIRNMFELIIKNRKIGVVGPKLVDQTGEIQKSTSGMPFLPQAIFAFSFLNKIWPKNTFSSKYWLYSFDYNQRQEVDYVCGACMMIRKSIFDTASGFDQRFFMYFEESDFCFRVKNLNYKVIYEPQAEVIHFGGKSLESKKEIKKIFEKSRFLFFEKYHGRLKAILAEFFIRYITITNICLLLILLLSFFLNVFKINEVMTFIGDQGWFYLSARDLILTGKIPLVGITSSHTWLHQGPLWTYILALTFWLFKFNPMAPAYFTALINILTVFLMYKIVSLLFGQKTGLISSILYATSPLVIIVSRMPYHTSLIPLSTLIFIYTLYQWLKGRRYFFVFSIFMLAILYNFELATAALWTVLLILLVYGFLKKKPWFQAIFNFKTISLSILAFIVPMIAIIIYDFSNGFMQTVKFSVWILYRIVVFSGLFDKQTSSSASFGEMLSFLSLRFSSLLFPVSNILFFLILILSFSIFFSKIFTLIKKNHLNNTFLILFLILILPLTAIIFNRVPSDAYLPMFFPSVIIMVAFSITELIKNRLLLTITVLIIAFVNAFSLISNNYYFIGPTFSQRLEIAKKIVKITGDKEYNIIGRGEGSSFASFTMNYEYLTWWLGKAVSKQNQKTKFVITENQNKVGLDYLNK